MRKRRWRSSFVLLVLSAALASVVFGLSAVMPGPVSVSLAASGGSLWSPANAILLAVLVILLVAAWQLVVRRKRAGAEMRSCLSLHEAVLAHIPSLILVLDSDMSILAANRNCLNEWGTKFDGAAGKNLADVLPSSLLERESLLHRVREVAGQGDYVELPAVLRKAGSDDAEFLNIAICGIPPSEGGSTGARVLLIMQDITAQRRMEEQMRQAAKMESIGRLAGGVAHDFNNILTGIRGFADFALEKAGNDSPVREDLVQIRELTRHAATLTGQLLAFSRRHAMEPVVLDINDVVENTIQMLKRLISKDVDLVFSPGTNLGSIRADPGQVQQVIMNLVANACDAMPRGGELMIETSNVTADQAYADSHPGAKAGPHVLLVVTDTGIGMDQDTIKKVFDPFFTTKEVGKGTGLGLATVYGIVKEHGGNIWVYSEPGKGTTFKTYLPRVDVKKVQPLPKPREATGKWEEAVPGGDEVVLVAEDEDTVRDLMRRVLEDRGYAVLCAATVEEAETTARRHRGNVDLLVSDVVLRGCDGQTLYERLAADYPRLKAVYMSGYTERTIARQGRLDPATAFLEKPFSPDTLARVVRDALDK